jgi:glucose/arabinose dehydrogenase
VPRFFVFFTDREGDVIVAEGSREAPAALRILVRIAHDESLYHNGGQLAFGPDGLLYAGVGDGGYLGRDPDPRGNSQNLGVLLGKIFRLDVSQPEPKPELVAYGLRNPWRFSFAPSGDLLIGDVGYNAAEEVDRLPAGTAGLVNFGWSVYEGRQKRRTSVALNPAGTLVWPVLTYRTFAPGNCAITGGFVYRGGVRALAGRYVYGDYCSGRIWSARIDAGRAVGVRREPFVVGDLASFGEDQVRELYVVSLAGTIYRLARR